MGVFGSIAAAVMILVVMNGLVAAAGATSAARLDHEKFRVVTILGHSILIGEGQVHRKELPMQVEQQGKWRAAPAAPVAPDQEGLALILRLAQAPGCTLIQNDAGSLALVAAYVGLRHALTGLGGDLATEHVRPDNRDLIVLLAVLDKVASGETLVQWLEETGAAPVPVWVAVSQKRPESDPARRWLQGRGTTAVGRLELTSGAGAARLVTDLYPLDPEVARRSVGEKLRAVEPVAEGPDNLAGRAEWFRRRAGPTR